MSDKSICHYGVVGMKWGVRRYQNKDGSLTSVGKQRLQTNGSKDKRPREKTSVIDRVKQRHADKREKSRQEKAVKKLEKKSRKVRNLSDADLDKRIERLRKEKEFRTLMRDLHPGKEYAKKLAKSFGERLVTDPLTYLRALEAIEYLRRGTTREIKLEREKRKTAAAGNKSN